MGEWIQGTRLGRLSLACFAALVFLACHTLDPWAHDAPAPLSWVLLPLGFVVCFVALMTALCFFIGAIVGPRIWKEIELDFSGDGDGE